MERGRRRPLFPFLAIGGIYYIHSSMVEHEQTKHFTDLVADIGPKWFVGNRADDADGRQRTGGFGEHAPPAGQHEKQ